MRSKSRRNRPVAEDPVEEDAEEKEETLEEEEQGLIQNSSSDEDDEDDDETATEKLQREAAELEGELALTVEELRIAQEGKGPRAEAEAKANEATGANVPPAKAADEENNLFNESDSDETAAVNNTVKANAFNNRNKLGKSKKKNSFVNTPSLFSLTPNQGVQGVLTLSTKEGQQLFDRASKKLSDDLFSVESSELSDFLYLLTLRASECGWNSGICMIPDDPFQAYSTKKSLLSNYGEIPIQRIKEYEITYLATKTRAAQDSQMLQKCIMSSLNKEGRLKIQTEKNLFTLNIRGKSMVSGNLLLKVIINKSYLEGKAATRAIRTKLAALDKLVPMLGFDIEKFNTVVKQLVQELKARGERSEDLNFNLMKAYKAVPGYQWSHFVTSIVTEQDMKGNIPIEELLAKTEAKFATLKSDGEWNELSEADNKIVALQAQISALNKKRKGYGGTEANSKNKKKSKKKKESFDRTKKPSNPLKPVQHDGKTWWWCGKETGGKCNMMRLHKPSECLGAGNVPPGMKTGKNKAGGGKSTGGNKKSGGYKRSKNGKKIQLESAYANATIAKESDDEYDITSVNLWGDTVSDAKASGGSDTSM